MSRGLPGRAEANTCSRDDVDGRHARRLLASAGMDARTLTRLHGLARVGLGAGLVGAPRVATAPWLGRVSRRPAAQVPVRAMGARDVAIGLGTAYAAGQGYGARPWLLAAIVSDTADLLATLHARDALPAAGVVGIAAMAGGSVLLELWFSSQVD